ncbi:pyridoxal 5'-phosphate synthase glutaminase subunit PdxT [Acidaminobacter hydrogenoformans]|uniref:Pyridoxal 5'-phosphate synthase subunit PdxT n=1 Tax=Acidaminobacter hydrogenoformans DSM 2784 TaxID=1120920 RepID=A0A1G5RZX8_9FIRM|nr:pyridoxal 5'-phosphate synthase glutaminase subunit PdxT [Acidaminobacter hydrogenoformans]SCZ79467.1 5'-phosphate synthase pdxT subunit [Acidaminobacter hydrogenoformans DSM 2784]
MKKTIGVLSLQGAFAEHIQMVQRLGAIGIEIRKKSDLPAHHLDGIILPGGESTVMGKLLHELDIFDDLQQLIKEGMPVMGTCAGMILLAKSINNDSKVHLGTMDIEVRRNAYGRQLGSFSIRGEFGDMKDVPMVFIRAPYIAQASKDVEVLAKVDNHIVAAKQGNMVVTSFHPELTSDTNVHSFFLDMVYRVK